MAVTISGTSNWDYEQHMTSARKLYEKEIDTLNKQIAYLYDIIKTLNARIEDEYSIRKEVEYYMCLCVSRFAQLDVAPPEPSKEVQERLQQIFVDAIKGE